MDRYYEANFQDILERVRGALPRNYQIQEMRFMAAYVVQAAPKKGEDAYTVEISLTPKRVRVVTGVARWQYTVYFDNLEGSYILEEVDGEHEEYREIEERISKELDSAFKTVEATTL